jgi:hypothetical protein
MLDAAPPEERQNFESLAQRTGLDPYTLMRGLQTEQQLYSQHPALNTDTRLQAYRDHEAWMATRPQADPKTSPYWQNTQVPERDQIAQTYSQLSPEDTTALRAWQHAQQVDSSLYSGANAGERTSLGGKVSPGDDSRAWLATLRPEVREQLLADEKTRRLVEENRYMGRPDDWEGLQGIATRWQVDPRDRKFQEYWGGIREHVEDNGWGNGAPARIEDVMRNYAREQARAQTQQQADEINNLPMADFQRGLGFIRNNPRTGREMVTVPGVNDPALGALGHIGGASKTLLSGAAYLPSLGLDVARHIGGNDDYAYSQMASRSAVQYPNDLLGTDVGHNMQIKRPGFQPGEDAHGEAPASGSFGMWSNPLTGNDSAAPTWAQQQGFRGDQGYLASVADHFDRQADNPDADYVSRATAGTLGGLARYGELAPEFLLGAKGLGAVGKGMQGSRLAAPASRAMQAAPAAVESGVASAATMAPLVSALEQTELGNARVKDHQQAIAQNLREWGNKPGSPVWQSMLGEAGASVTEAGPWLLTGGRKAAPALAGLAGLSGAAEPAAAEIAGGSQGRGAHMGNRLAELYPQSIKPNEAGEMQYQPGQAPDYMEPGTNWRDVMRQKGQQPGLMGLDGQRLADAGPEAAAQVQQAAPQVLEAVGSNPDTYRSHVEAATTGDPNNPAAKTQLGNLQEQTGLPFMQAADMWQDMDTGSKVLLGLGLGLGTISLLSGLSGEGGLMSWLTSLLGFGAAAGVLSNAGAFGPEAQQFMQGLTGGGPEAAQPNATPTAQPSTPPTAQPNTPPNTPAAQGNTQQPTGHPPAAAGNFSFDDLATKHKLPTDLGDPSVFDEPDQEAFIGNFIRHGTRSNNFDAIASDLPPDVKQQLKDRVRAEAGGMLWLMSQDQRERYNRIMQM